MLAITDIAAEAIKSLTTDAELPDGGGLRIAAPSPDQGLELSLAGQPGADDVVLSGDGVAVFLEPVAAQVLDDKVLDVQPVQGVDGEQELRFAIGPQADLRQDQPDD
ncbi:adhesin [Pseudonocardia abyssalis]|jgi:Fe-S cluster assembly iron-binding protein IscA|uniref:Adhesin n=1 Tax=Pseudonocardia abyssalis TaxID=2792008 RepID=A0ABS6V0Z5_9PSEU|nr:adhesin [Pseudonocardia abyssalis]MBW0116118.1 adhesin [Pseudonocardia abyssalis]MBW0137906.1 adhesin [Pseudonocardia abyssalis]